MFLIESSDVNQTFNIRQFKITDPYIYNPDIERN